MPYIGAYVYDLSPGFAFWQNWFITYAVRQNGAYKFHTVAMMCYVLKQNLFNKVAYFSQIYCGTSFQGHVKGREFVRSPYLRHPLQEITKFEAWKQWHNVRLAGSEL